MPSHADLARTIGDRFYGADTTVEPVTEQNNAVFRLRCPGGDKYLKLAKSPDNSSVRKELLLLEVLGPLNLPTPVVEHADVEGALVGRPFLITASAGERTVGSWLANPDGLARRLFAEMGAVLARIHTAPLPAPDALPPGAIAGRDARECLGVLSSLTAWVTREGLLDPAEVALFRSAQLPDPGGARLCHGDYHTVHCVVGDGRITAVVDWESAWAGNAAIDLAVTHAYLDYYCRQELVRCFVAGYASAGPLPDDYTSAYLPVRMAQALALARVWHRRGPQANVRRAVELYREYGRQAAGRGVQ